MRGCASYVTKRQRWAGRAISAVPILFMLLDGGMKLFKPSFVVQATTQLGFPESTIVGIGAILVLSVLLHLLPRTSFLGALLVTAYLGGAVASKVRIGAPLFDFAFALIIATLLWGGFWLRDASVRELLPIRRVAKASPDVAPPDVALCQVAGTSQG
jgi:DoxX-like family